MTKYQTPSSPSKGEEGVCGRVYRAVNGRSAFKSLRRGSPRPHQSSASPEIAVAYNHGQEANTGAVPKANAGAKNLPAVVLHPRPRVQEPVGKEKRVSLAEDHHHHHHKASEENHAHYYHNNNNHHHHEAHFSDYIARVRARINRTLTHAGGGEGGGNVKKAAPVVRRDSFNDKVSNYIHRARMSIRTTSNVGDGKNSGGFKN